MLADRYELARAQQKKLQNNANGQPRLPFMSRNGQLTKSLHKFVRFSGYFKALQQEDTSLKGETEPCCQEPKIVGA
jgi:hypothetical protein